MSIFHDFSESPREVTDSFKELCLAARLYISATSSQKPPILGTLDDCDDAIIHWKQSPEGFTLNEMIWKFGAYFGYQLVNNLNMLWMESHLEQSFYKNYAVRNSKFKILVFPFETAHEVILSPTKSFNHSYMSISELVRRAEQGTAANP